MFAIISGRLFFVHWNNQSVASNSSTYSNLATLLARIFALGCGQNTSQSFGCHTDSCLYGSKGKTYIESSYILEECLFYFHSEQSMVFSQILLFLHFLYSFNVFQRYGRCPSDHEVKASGNCCPICHDNFQEPTILNCKHIFCEECVATWFDRERTCPMCRSQVSDC